MARKLVGSLCFSIEGGWLTDHCRNLVLEDNHVHAIRTLQSLDGIPMEMIFEILKGNKTLEGTNTLTLKDDNNSEYKAKLRWKYAGMIRFRGGLYRPYALVVSYGSGDMGYAYDAVGESWKDQKDIRALFYADDKSNDFARNVVVKDRESISPMCLFKRMNNVPDFLALDVTNQSDFQKAFDECVEAHANLEVRGWIESGYQEQYEESEDTLRKFSKIRTEKEEAIRVALNKEKGLDEDGLDEWGLEPGEKHLQDFRDDKLEKNRLAWVLPDGEVYSCKYMEHRHLADVICKMKYGLGKCNNPEREPENLLAIKLGSSMFDGPYVGWEFDNRGKYTQAQMDIVYDWCKKHGGKFPKEAWEAEDVSDN